MEIALVVMAIIIAALMVMVYDQQKTINKLLAGQTVVKADPKRDEMIKELTKSFNELIKALKES